MSSIPEKIGEPNRTLRWVLGVAFTGLVILMVVAGLTALSDLNRMHAEERDARRSFVERTQVITGLCLSIQSYNQTAERYLASPEPSQADIELMARLQAAIDSSLHSFPSDDLTEEVQSIHNIQDLFVRQKSMFDEMLAWPTDQRRLRAVETIHREVDPIEVSILEWSDRLRADNDRTLRAADQAALAQFAHVQTNLTWSLVLALGSGLILVLASMLYILRLEHQIQARYGELSRSRSELEMLSARLVEAQESERRKISRELHDEVGQTLGALLVDFGRLSAALSTAPVEVRDQVDHMKSVAERSVQTVRNLALLLRPSMLDDLGLVAALEWQGRETSRNSGTEVEVRAEGVPESLPDEFNVTIYRLVQEALNNAVRHSGARNARVNVTGSGGRIVVVVSDDGRGFDPRRSRGVGILGMEERVRRLGGRLTIDSQPGRGATIRAELPLETAR
ncbi:MAG TPA: sensor histidine kinase [Verrucomicrobiae bacterium]|nr:sensor histidine kinase [Verrucomicrobiae bacterium]